MLQPVKTFYVYIVTNPNKTTLYIGVTNNLAARLIEHWRNRGHTSTFAGRYFCFNLIYFERFEFIEDAIAREKCLKKWSREKKNELIRSKNKEWAFLNERIYGQWPPDIETRRFS